METKEIKALSLLPDEMLTPRLVALAQEITVPMQYLNALPAIDLHKSHESLDSMTKNRPKLNIKIPESHKAYMDSLKRLREEYTRDNEALPRTDSESATKASPDSIK